MLYNLLPEASEPYPTKQQGNKLATNVTVAIFNKCS
jgi:hypothetical protein